MTNPIPGADAERAAFEKWAVSDDGGWMPHALARNQEGHEFDYVDDDVQAEWRAFHAGVNTHAGSDVASQIVDTVYENVGFKDRSELITEVKQMLADRAAAKVGANVAASLPIDLKWDDKVQGYVSEPFTLSDIAAGAPARERSPYVLGVKPSNWAEQVAAGAPAETQCKWPTCLPESAQQALAAEVHGELYSGAPAETPKPALGELALLAGVQALCIAADQEWGRQSGALSEFDKGWFTGQLHIFDLYTPTPKESIAMAREYIERLSAAAQPAPAPIAGADVEKDSALRNALQAALDDAALGRGSYGLNYDGNKLAASVRAAMLAASSPAEAG